jgi:uncharacterized repeat protein (TIGR01451 family)
MNARLRVGFTRLVLLCTLALPVRGLAAIASNNPPVAVNDSAAATSGVLTVINALANDYDPNGDPIGIYSYSAPLHGSVYSASNQFYYQSVSNYCGPDSFTYLLTDFRGGFSSNATVSINVGGCISNSPPVASNDSATVGQGSNVLISVLANDYDPNGDFISIFGYTQPVYGSVTQSGTQLLYQASFSFCNPDQFSYFISDGRGGTATGTVFVTVTCMPSNYPPVAANDSATVASGVSTYINVLSNDYDPDFDFISIWSYGQPAHGAVFQSGGLYYQSYSNYTGPDSFGYTITDNHGNYSSALVSITVTNGGMTNPPASADLSLIKNGPPESVSVGDIITYTLFAYNAGPNTATNVVVRDAIPSGTIYGASSGGTCTFYPQFQRVDCDVGNLTPGSWTYVYVTVQVTNAGPIVNCGNVSASTPDPNTTNNASCISNFASFVQADVQVTKTANSSSVPVGQTNNFRLELRNNGPGPVTNLVTVSEVIPPGFEYMYDTAGTNGDYYSPGMGLWVLPGGIGPMGSAVFCTITVRATNAGLYTNMVAVNLSMGVSDPNTNNNRSQVVVTVTPVPVVIQFVSDVFGRLEDSTAPLNLERIGNTNVACSVNWSWTGGTATPGADFTGGTTGVVTFAAGQTIAPLPIAIVDDLIVEPTETANFYLSEPVNATIGSNNAALLNIYDNDTNAPLPKIQFVTDLFGRYEDQTPPLNLERIGDTNGACSVTWTWTGGTATPGLDFTGGSNGVVNFAPGQTIAPLPITIVDDLIVEPTETANFALSSPVNAMLGSNTSALLNIFDNDRNYTISGRVLECTTNGTGLPNVTVVLAGTGFSNAAVTGAGGQYTFNNVPSGNYTVTPSRSNYVFLPPGIAVNITTNDVTVSNFVGVSFVITGLVREGTNMPVKPMAAVAVKLSGTQTRTNFTDASGVYAFTNVPPGTYTVTPMTNGYCFEPTNATLYLTNITAVTNGCTNVVNFVGMSNTPPGIVTQSMAFTNYIGSNIILSVTVTGCPPLSYQWYFDTNIIAAATNSTLTISNLQTTNMGGYTLVITNPFGSVTSAPICVIVCVPALGSRTPVINIVPNMFSYENAQNAEPSMGVNPRDQRKVMIGTFDSTRAEAPFLRIATNRPYFLSDSGGGGHFSWSLYDDIIQNDTTVEWSPGGTAYAIIMTSANNRLTLLSSANPPGGAKLTAIGASVYTSTSLPDQPWLDVSRSGANDRIYIAFNDLGQRGTAMSNTATIRFSTDSGATWNNEVIERLVPFSQDGPGVRVAISGNTVYGAFERWTGWGANTNATGGDRTAQIIVVRDDNGGAGMGAGRFTALGTNGTNVTATYPVGATNQIAIPYSDINQANPPVITAGTPLGHQDLGSDLAIAADPNRTNRVFVAYAETQTEGANFSPRVFVAYSSDAGQTWRRVFTADTNSAMPTLAVADNGAVGLMYTRMRSGLLETRFLQSADNFTSVLQDIVLASFPDNTPLPIRHPYIGDYEDLETVSNVFYGTFCAGNDPDPANFPEGVYYQRNVKINGCVFSNFWLTAKGELASTNGVAMSNSVYTPKGVSIDPFFFNTPALGAPLIDLEITKLDAPDPIDLRVTNKLLYTISVTNSGPSLASMIVVTDSLPAGVVFVSATNTHGTCTLSNGVVMCSVSNLAYRGSATIRITVMPMYAGTITNTTRIGGAETDANPANNVASAVTTVLGPPVPNWSQPPGFVFNPGQPQGEDRASDFDWRAQETNCVVADDFLADGRRVVFVRWWGSYLNNHNFGDEDGYVLSFFTDDRPPGTFSRPGTLLGTYIAPLTSVQARNTGFIGWDNLFIYEYQLALSNACLAHADTNYATAAAFLAGTNQVYWLAVQAEVGHVITPLTNGQGVVTGWNETVSGKAMPADYFWGWHTGPRTNLDISVTGLMTMDDTNWLYGAWIPNQPDHMELDQAFELFTDAGGPPVGNCPPASLRIALMGNQVVITWSDPAYRLQGKPSLDVPQWTDIPGSSPVTLPAAGAARFFRLHCQ